ncbi:MAG TPA: calcium/sodium antiporter [Cyclobacteriaceae bacterium]|nr:calcium/sodium antiporter [Cyclobacteriaceae bacterium]
MLSYFFEGLVFQFLDLVIGFAILIKGADFLVNGSSSIAKKNGISNLAIGLTVVAFGTSMPELIVSLLSALDGKNDASFGNVIGSNNFNLLFILGVSGLIYPLTVQRNTVKYEVPLSLLAVGILFILVNDQLVFGSETNGMNRFDSIVLLLFFAGFLLYIYRTMKNGSDLGEEAPIKVYGTGVAIGMVVLGLAMLIGGGTTVVNSATSIAQYYGLSEKLIGLTILAAGTSLPELATSAVAAYRKNTDIAIGNVVGSNIFNIFFILGITGVINPMPYNTVMNFDLYVLMASTVVLMIFMFTINQRKLDRWEAFLLLAGYITYTMYLIGME